MTVHSNVIEVASRQVQVSFTKMEKLMCIIEWLSGLCAPFLFAWSLEEILPCLCFFIRISPTESVKPLKLSDNKYGSLLDIMCKFGVHILSRSEVISVFVETHRPNSYKI